MKFLNQSPIWLAFLLVLLAALAGCSLFQTLGIAAPDAPAGLTVGNPKPDSLDISWKSSLGAMSYQLYRATSSSGPWTNQVYDSTAMEFTDTDLSSGTTYYYVVTAKNSVGVSPVSTAASALTSGGLALTAPTISAATAGNAQVAVTWAAVTGAASYNLYWAPGTMVTVKNGTKIPNATSPQIVPSLSNGAEYAFIVAAVNSSGGESTASATATATLMTSPSPPTITCAAGDAQVTITWAVVAGATSYNLYWAPGTTVTTSGTKISNATSPQIVPSLTAGAIYACIVTAVNSSGESAASNIATATPLPQAPTISSDVAGDGKVTVTWAGVAGAASYNLYWAQGTTVTTSGTKISNATSPQTVASLSNGTEYAFIVTAIGSAGGESGASTVAMATPPIYYSLTRAIIASLDGTMTGAMLWAHDPPGEDDIPVGTTVIYITRNGYYGAFTVTSRDYAATHNISFNYTTFKADGSVLQTSGSTPVTVAPYWLADLEAAPANVQTAGNADLSWWLNTGGMELYLVGNGSASRMAKYQ